jgi:uncharacterized membrane protein YcjF (UPF0283 family)
LSEEIRKKESLEEEEKAKEKIARRKSEVEARNTRAAAKAAAAEAATEAAAEAASRTRNSSGLSNRTIKASVILLPALCFFQRVSLTHCLTPI